MSRQYNNVGKAHMRYDFNENDDIDQLFDSETQHVFAVKRANTWMSFNFAVDSINEFGRNGGFDRIIAMLKSIRNGDKTASMQHL